MRAALIRRGLAAVCIGLWFGAAAADTVKLTVAEARVVAQRALLSGDAALAVALARKLLEADARDPFALLILAAAEPKLGDPLAGLRAGRAAWGAAAPVPLLRYEIARNTALASLQSGRPLSAAFWLRRAVEIARSPEERAQSLGDLATLRQRIRLHYAIDVSVTPSSNLNGGATGGFLIIDNALTVGPISRSGQALAGEIATEQVSLSYDLTQSARTATHLGFQLYATQNRLSPAARRDVQDLKGPDLNQTTSKISFGTDFLLHAVDRVPGNLTFALGQSSVGAASPDPYASFSLTLPVASTDRASLSANVTLERHWHPQDQLDAVSAGLAKTVVLSGGGQLGLGLTASRIRGHFNNQDYDGLNAYASLAPTWTLGSLRFSGQLSVGVVRYDPYYLIGNIQVTHGRTDRSATLSLVSTLTKVQLAGYAPTIGLNLGRKWSNISRYTTQDVSVTFGYRSLF